MQTKNCQKLFLCYRPAAQFFLKKMADYKKLSGSRVEFSLEIPEEQIKKSQKVVIERLRKQVRIPGFRKGSAPDNAVMSAAGGERVTWDTLDHAVDGAFKKFVREHELQVVGRPQLDVGNWKKTPLIVKIAVEVFPEVKLGDYKKITFDPLKIDITEEEVDDVVRTIFTDMQLGEKVDRSVENGDVVVIDFAGKDKDGSTLTNTDGKEQRIRLGVGHFLEDLEKGIVGMKAGEEKTDISVKFPKNYHSKKMAGKSVRFEVKLHSVESVSPSLLNESRVEKIIGEKKSVEAFRDDIKNLITENKTDAERKKRTEEFQKKLFKLVKCELPASWVEDEINSRLERVKQSPQYQHDPGNFWEKSGKSEDDLKKEFKVVAEESLKIYLALTEIAKTEEIEMTPEEMADIEKKVADAPKNLDRDQVWEKEVVNRKIDKFLAQAVS